MKQPAILVQVVLLAIIFASPLHGKNLKSWLTDHHTRNVAVSATFQSDSFKQEVLKKCEHCQEITQLKEMKTAKVANSNEVYIFNGAAPERLDDKIKPTATNFLPFVENQAAFMYLNHKAFGNFFATTPLSGCDVWIADAKRREPVIIHINANELGEDPLQNLEYKEDLAQKILKHLGHQYQFVLRVSYDFAKDRNSRRYHEGIEKYWNGFKSKFSGVPLVLYEIKSGLGFLYGTHDIEFEKLGRVWNFFLKDLGKGDIVKKVGCSIDKLGCVIM